MSLHEHHVREAASIYGLDGTADLAERPGANPGRVVGGEPEYVPWGDDTLARDILATLGSVELEYAAIRRGVGLVDAAARSALEVSGRDGVDLLDSILTQKIELSDAAYVPAFLLERTGRILADMHVVQCGGRVLLDLDWTDMTAIKEAISTCVFTEDVQVESTGLRVLELHGPRVDELLTVVGVCLPEEACASAGVIGGCDVMMGRFDATGNTGIRLWVEESDLGTVWDTLHAAAAEAAPCRTVGWYAFNMARIEAGTPWWHVDVGRTSLPHESGMLRSRVRFNKGCYPGQEVVARMEHLGHPKQVVCMLEMPDDRLPVAGAQVFAAGEESVGNPIGVVTSSCPSPARSGAALALAVLKWKHAQGGGSVRVVGDGDVIDAPVKVLDATESST